MNWIDAVILATLAWFTYSAFNAGLIREIITIIGAILAVALAGLFYTELAKDIDVAISDPQKSQVVAFAVIFGATILASQLVALFLKEAASLLMLGIFDSLGGAIFGFAKGFIIVEVALIFAWTFKTLGLERAVDHSALAPLFLDFLPFLRHILPGAFKREIDAF